MTKIYNLFFLLLFLFSSFNLLHAQIGVYDAGFGSGGKVFQLFASEAKANAVALQPNGKIVVGGSGTDFLSEPVNIVRYNADGSLDSSFGSNGIAAFTLSEYQDVLESIVIQPDGKIIAGGLTQTTDQQTQQSDADFFLLRIKPDGSLDSTFGTNGLVVTDFDLHSQDQLHKVVLKPDGKILAGGYFMNSTTGDNFYGLVQYKIDGSRDSTFGTDGISTIPLPQQEEGKGSLAVLPNGKILVATTVVNDTSFFYEFGLVRFNANGIADASFGNGGVVHLGLNYFHSVLHDMGLQTDGKIVLTGQTQSNNATVIAVVRVDSTGLYDANFGNNGVVRTHISADRFTPDAGMTLSIQPDQKILVGCTLDNSTNSMDANFAVVRYLPGGAIDSNFGRHGIIVTDFNGNGDFVKAGVQQPDGKLILVGSAESENVETGFGIARYLSDARYYYNNLKGSVFYDNNRNGVKDAGEEFYGNAVVAAEKPGIDTIMISASTGRFDVDLDTGTYIIRPMQPLTHPDYYIPVPPTSTISHSAYFNTDSISFAMQPIPGMHDIFVFVIPLNTARPGFSADYMIMYGNNGTDTVPAGRVQFIPDSLVNVTSSSPAWSLASADTLSWDYVNLYPHDTSFIIVHTSIQPPPLVNIGDTLTFTASVSPAAFDQQIKDNNFVLNEEVAGSYDPNDKSESHAGQITPEELNAGDHLQYIIRFQNTGTDTAFNIYIRDTLDNKLNWGTIETVTASHPFKMIMDAGVSVWSFNNIRLVDSTHNEPNSHGYIVYRIKPKANLAIGDTIRNTASIYFDYNLPVATNTEKTIIVSKTVLPVKLLSFSAIKTGNTNLLLWSTTSEINAGRFEVERSATGSGFKKIGFTPCKPGNEGIKNYDYTDALPLTGINYYRLKILDNNGRFEYSPVRIINKSTGNYFSLYPNPVKDILRIKIVLKEKSILQVQVVTHDGKLVRSTLWNVDEGTVEKTINTTSLPGGFYFLKIIPLTDSPGNIGTAPIILKFEKL